jgi:hypothetical protein
MPNLDTECPTPAVSSAPLVAEVCACSCHAGHEVMHFVPCCYLCHKCRQRIVIDFWERHIETCSARHPEANAKIRLGPDSEAG